MLAQTTSFSQLDNKTQSKNETSYCVENNINSVKPVGIQRTFTTKVSVRYRQAHLNTYLFSETLQFPLSVRERCPLRRVSLYNI